MKFIYSSIFIGLLVVVAGCVSKWSFKEELLYAEIIQPQSDKSSTRLLLKTRNHDVFTASVYELKLISTSEKSYPLVSTHFRKDNSGGWALEYLEIDLPALKDVEEWKKSFDENKLAVLYPKPPTG